MAIVDAALRDVVRASRWRRTAGGYVVSCEKPRRFLHHLVLPRRAGCMVDHVNGDQRDNRRANLRYADASQNQGNQRRVRGQVPYKGVCRSGRRYRAQITVHGQKYHLGSYADPKDAARAYWWAARRAFGAFAWTNLTPGERDRPIPRDMAARLASIPRARAAKPAVRTGAPRLRRAA